MARINQRAIRSFILIIIGTVYALYAMVPSGPTGIGLDNSWRLAITEAARRHLRFGHDIVFTYGPLGYVVSGVPEVGLAGSLLIFKLLLVTFVTSAFLPTMTRETSTFFKIAVGSALFFVASVATIDYAVFCGVIVIFTRVGRNKRAESIRGIAIGCALAFGILSKFSLAIDVAAIAVTVWTIDMVRGPNGRRIATALAAVSCVSIASVLVISAFHFSLGDASAFLRGAIEITAGYTAAMATDEPRTADAGAIVVAATLVIASTLAVREQKLIPAAVTLIAMFLTFKHGFVRGDPSHYLVFFATACVLSSLVAIDLRTYRAFGMASVAVVFAAFAFVTSTVQTTDVRTGVSFDIARIARSARFIAAPQRVTADDAKRSAELLAQDHLPSDIVAEIGGATVDVIPFETAIFRANGLRWKPIPTFQSYSAYTPRLDRANRDSLVESGADVYLYTYTSIDGRLPFSDMPATMVALLCRYRFVNSTAIADGTPILVFRRASTSLCSVSSTVAIRDAEIGKPIPVPRSQFSGSFIRASFDVRPTMQTKVRSLLYKPDQVDMTLIYKNGAVSRWRLVVATLADGVIVSPGVHSTAEMESFLRGRFSPTIVSITLSASPGSYVLRGVSFTEIRRPDPIGHKNRQR